MVAHKCSSNNTRRYKETCPEHGRQIFRHSDHQDKCDNPDRY
jgi:hypothetical protein